MLLRPVPCTTCVISTVLDNTLQITSYFMAISARIQKNHAHLGENSVAKCTVSNGVETRGSDGSVNQDDEGSKRGDTLVLQ